MRKPKPKKRETWWRYRLVAEYDQPVTPEETAYTTKGEERAFREDGFHLGANVKRVRVRVTRRKVER